jgi:hypothetical protein
MFSEGKKKFLLNNMSNRVLMLFAATVHVAKGLCPQPTAHAETRAFIMCLAVTRSITESIMERKFVLPQKSLIGIKTAV